MASPPDYKLKGLQVNLGSRVNDTSILSSARKRDKLARQPIRELIKANTNAEFERRSSPRLSNSQSKRKNYEESDDDDDDGDDDDEDYIEEDDNDEVDDEKSPKTKIDISKVQSHPDKAYRAESMVSPPNPVYRTSSPYSGEDDGQKPVRKSLSRGGKKKPEQVPKFSSDAIDSQEEDLADTSTVSASSKLRKKETFWTNSGMAVILIMFLAVAGAYMNQSGKHALPFHLGLFVDDIKQPQVTRQMVVESVVDLQDVFPSQPSKTWKMMKSNLVRINSDHSEQAACIVVIGDSKWTKCFAKAVAATASKLRNKTVANQGLTAFTRDGVENSLRLSDSVVILDINKVSGEQAMILHSFCDSATGTVLHPYVNSAVISTINQRPRYGELPEDFAGNILTQTWTQTVTEDKISSLITRIVLEAVYFEPEPESEKIQQFCQN